MFSFTTGAYASHAWCWLQATLSAPHPVRELTHISNQLSRHFMVQIIIFHNISEVYADYKYLLSNKSLWHMQEHNIELNIKNRMICSPMKHIRIGELIKIFYNSWESIKTQFNKRRSDKHSKYYLEPRNTNLKSLRFKKFKEQIFGKLSLKCN